MMDRNEAEQILAGHAEARDALLRRITADAGFGALWQIGSFAAGEADAWSDLDLVVSPGPAPVGDPAFVLDNPANGPAGGGYIGAAYLTGPLLVWVDWYAWPADLPVPVEARLLAGEGRRGELALFDALDRHGRGTAPAESDPSTFALAMIPIAAKYVARGELEAVAGMLAMLGGDPYTDPVTALRELLRAAGGPAPLVERVGRTIDVAAALRR
ncbi:hypothetical protein O1R50_24770 [Glycomyces luteolus]|uniref:Nucleotidyltransferase-like protein n=1 Tax=Glycomyces luteolus TaxID=2670330 RepID=A0A9X3PHS7_9ACTN|nr:hypothetical protein [Glycomyces luteolus]MDA1362854.1 hypothetical protein [Glycomyces luteolus]